jgi:hypothetical protein
MSIHPTTTNAEMDFVCEGIMALAKHHETWAKDYDYSKYNNEFVHKSTIGQPDHSTLIDAWFDLA